VKALEIQAGGKPTDSRLYVQESGTPGAPAVVFLHGAGASGRMWRQHTARLAGRFHCLAPDLPGLGRSNQLPSASVLESADLVAELIQTRVPAQRAHLVGLSWGGGVAHALLARHPELVDRVVIDDAGVLVLSWWGGALVRLAITLVAPFLHTRPVMALFSTMIGMDQEGRAELRASSRRAFWRAFWEGFNPPPIRIAIDAPCPTLLVAGEKETTIRASNAALAALMPHAVARFAPGLGHGWLARRTGLHVRMVETWLSGQQLPSELIAEPPSPSAVERLLRQLKGEPSYANDPRARARAR
jgi:pimeloyl-ACP methyl ester carboxylesterase